MTNKLRRSMTSVLLAASLLFSSQSVVAFADYGSKSDASDLSPVQESVENATEEQQEDPSLSVEPVIGESTEAPVAAPMMARANAPVAYSAPDIKSGYTELETYTAIDTNAIVRVYYRQTGNNTAQLEKNSGSFDYINGYRTYSAKPDYNSDWVFAGWDTEIYREAYSVGLLDYPEFKETNSQGTVLGRYAFSMRGEENNEYNKKDTDIQVNRIHVPDDLMGHPAYYTLYANFNPLVTVNYDNNQGIVTAANSHGDDKFEAEYAQDKVFTITPNSGYEVASVTANGTSITANPDGTYTLESVTEPTTLYVEFEKAEDVITVDDIDGAVIVTVACDNLPEHTYQYSLKANGEENENYEITVEKANETATLHLLKDGWLHTFVSQPGFENHQLSDDSSNLINI